MGSTVSESRRLAVCERDEWQCRMPRCWCPSGRDMNPALFKVDDPWAPTVDHIIPLAQGGDNTDANLRAAHKDCNNAGAVKMGRQLNAVANPPRKGMRDLLGKRIKA